MGEDRNEEFGVSYVLREIRNDVGELRKKQGDCATKAELAVVSAKLDQVVPRSEHNLRWENDSRRFDDVDRRLSDISDRMATKKDFSELQEAVDQGPLRPYVVPALGMIIAIVSLIITFLHGGR